ncbi:MAG: hypothetical protein H6727_05575 [Myxococcales bacterium]|nr:hypothetical protein [Myxococcales bacterium]
MNPEIQRYAWLELSIQRLILIPLVLIGLSMVSGAKGTTYVGLLGFVSLTMLWGIRASFAAIPKEVNDHTWDWQRMSALSPWTMAWGKLVGSTLAPWYGGLISLVLFSYGGLQQSPISVFQIVLFLIGVAIALQAFGMMVSLQLIRQPSFAQKRGNRWLGVAVSLFFFFSLFIPATVLLTEAVRHFFKKGNTFQINVYWYHINIGKHLISFTLITVYVFVIWSLIGLYRSMRVQQQYTSSPSIWLIFVVFLLSYVAGFSYNWERYLFQNPLMAPEFGGALQQQLFPKLITAMPLAVGLVYLTMLIEAKDPVGFRKLFNAAQKKRFGEMFSHIPAWFMNIGLFLLLLLATLWSAPKFLKLSPQGFNLNITIFLWTIFFFTLRDVSLILWNSLSPSSKNSDFISIVYLFLLYFLIPGLLNQAGQHLLSFYIMPINPKILMSKTPPNFMALLISAVAQSAIFLVLCGLRWKQHFSKAEAAPIPKEI